MIQVCVEHDTKLPHPDQTFEAGAEWSEIFESLAKLQTGLHKAQADLGQIRADLEAFRESLDAPPEDGLQQ